MDRETHARLQRYGLASSERDISCHAILEKDKSALVGYANGAEHRLQKVL